MSHKLSSRIVLTAASVALIFGVAACSKTSAQDNGAQGQAAQTDQSQDPASTGNLAPRTELRLPIPVISSRQVSRSLRRLSRLLRLRQCNRSHKTRPIPTASPTPTTSKRITASRCFRPNSLRRHYRNIRSLQSPAMAIYGRPDIGASSSGLFLGARRLGVATSKWVPVDARILGIRWRNVWLQLRFLGPICRLLRRH